MSDNYHIWWDEELGLARGQAFSLFDIEDAIGIVEETERIANERGTGIDWLVDLTQLTSITSPARKKLTEAIGHPSIRKFAFFGASTFVRVVVNFMSKATGKTHTRHFTTEASALEWIFKREG